MAAATLSGRRQNRIMGDIRSVTWLAATFANTGDTVTIPGIKTITSIDFVPTTNASCGFTVTAVPAVLTIVSGGALTGLLTVRGL